MLAVSRRRLVIAGCDTGAVFDSFFKLSHLGPKLRQLLQRYSQRDRDRAHFPTPGSAARQRAQNRGSTLSFGPDRARAGRVPGEDRRSTAGGSRVHRRSRNGCKIQARNRRAPIGVAVRSSTDRDCGRRAAGRQARGSAAWPRRESRDRSRLRSAARSGDRLFAAAGASDNARSRRPRRWQQACSEQPKPSSDLILKCSHKTKATLVGQKGVTVVANGACPRR